MSTSLLYFMRSINEKTVYLKTETHSRQHILCETPTIRDEITRIRLLPVPRVEITRQK